MKIEKASRREKCTLEDLGCLECFYRLVNKEFYYPLDVSIILKTEVHLDCSLTGECRHTCHFLKGSGWVLIGPQNICTQACIQMVARIIDLRVLYKAVSSLSDHNAVRVERDGEGQRESARDIVCHRLNPIN